MDLDLTEEQVAVQDGLDRLLTRFREPPAHGAVAAATGATLRAELEQSGFLDCARTPGMGALEAVLLIEGVAALPHVVEIGASALVVPLLLPDRELRGPVALLRAERGTARFLQDGGSAIIDDGTHVRIATADTLDVRPAETPFGYPYGSFDPRAAAGAPIDVSVDVAALRQWWRVMIAAEIGAIGRTALELTVGYVKERRQFGRAIGSFQAVQHRLAECRTLIEGITILTRRAAVTGSATAAAVAAAYAQAAASKLIYETHQFHGAIGLTLEYPLHLWTFRLRSLQGEAGGTASPAADVSTPDGGDAILWDPGL
jgi:hypothetical protein